METREKLTEEELQDYRYIVNSYNVMNNTMNNNSAFLLVPDESLSAYVSGVASAWANTKLSELKFMKKIIKSHNLPANFRVQGDEVIFDPEVVPSNDTSGV